MRISRVIIENWRSAKSVDFYPADLTLLVGANNAGKTNILSAINFLIGDRWPIPGNLLDSDFFMSDRNRRLHIQLSFKDAPYSCLDFDTGRTQYTLQAYDNHGELVRRGFDNDERARLGFAYVDASRSFERQFGSSRYSLFGQAIRLLHDDLHRAADGKVPALRAVLQKAHHLLKTPLYDGFELSLRQAFAAQLRTSGYDVQFEFRTLDETNLYRNLYPTLIERGKLKAPGEVGSGVRNLLVLALFHAFAKAFKGGAILGIEEPELFLHPHAQRSLMNQFEELAKLGNQLLISSHSATFLDVTRPERIVVVECCEDDEEEVCTQVRTTSAEKLLAARKALHPGKEMMTLSSMRAFLRNVRTAETAEAYFARLVIVAEGPSEREALPLLCASLGLKFDEEGISIIAAGGKTVIDMLAQIYQAHEIPLYIIFDNDDGIRAADREYNKVICRLLGVAETDLPAARVTANYAILSGDWEAQMKADLEAIEPGLYENMEAEARAILGIRPDKNKPLIARFVAEQIIAKGVVPSFVREIARCLRHRLGLPEPIAPSLDDEEPRDSAPSGAAFPTDAFDDDLPF
jgi:putative ATP-dependent endonuclease of OLD family